MAWISPTWYNDIGSIWYQEEYAYDKELWVGAYANESAFGEDLWLTDWLEFTFWNGLTYLEKSCSKIRFHADMTYDNLETYANVDIYYNNEWHDIYEGVVPPYPNIWFEVELGGTYVVSKIRFKFKNQYTGSLILNLFEVEFYEEEVVTITTQATTQVSYQCAMGNGTITSGTNATERGFEIKIVFSAFNGTGTLNDAIEHSIAGFVGDVTWDIVNKWHGTLVKTESETGDFAQGAYELVLGYPSVFGNPSSVFNDKLFKCESYTYRARATIGGVVYYGEYVAFSTLCDSGGDQQPTDDISEGDPTVPIIPIEEIPPYPPFEFEKEEPEPYPPWEWDIPPYEYPDYPPMSFVGDFYYKKPYTKKDLDELRAKCIIYNKNSVEFALVLRHNMNVLREFFNMMTDYMGKDEFNDFTDIIPPQRLKELYLDPLEVNDFKDMINGFIRNTVDNNIAVNRNFNLIQEGLSDYETGSDDAYFTEINSAMKTVTEDNPDVDTLKRVIDNLNSETALNFNNIMHNLEILRARLL